MPAFVLFRRAAWLALLFITLGSSVARAQEAKPFLHPLFTDNMVLQRGMTDPVWGWTTPGQTVTLSLNGKTAKAVAGPDGKWLARIGPFQAGGPYTLTVSGPQLVTLSNVLIGDVWICSGQSNMEFGIGNALNAQAEIAAANYPQIRLLLIEHKTAPTPQETMRGGPWAICAPDTVRKGGWNGFSAVGYFFGRDLYQNQHVPIGLIESDWGGTVAEAWTSAEALNTLPDFQPAVASFQKSVPATGSGQKSDPNVVTVLYNGMIAPLVPYGIKGALWYQGEANASRAKQYQTLLPTLIKDWRSRFWAGNFPFLIVQLAGWAPGGDDWPKLQEAQWLTAKNVPNTGLVTAVDLGDPKDIHPKNKQEVGRRLALIAEAKVYSQKVEYYGPVYKGMTKEGGAIRLTFDHLGGGLTAKDGKPLTGFTVAGADGKFAAADARIDGDTVIVSAPDVPQPTGVRYGWASYPEMSLYSKAGLPAFPFRTDTDKPGR